MNVLLVYAHPEPRSLNGSIRDFALQHLEAAGHKVWVSDLYNMGWKATLDADDNTNQEPGTRFDPALDSKRALENGWQSKDIELEQEKLMWADAVILQFPMWWFSMPAILKGWVERVFAYGLAYGVGEHSDTRWGDRYGEGKFKGKRAMLIVTAGGWESHYSHRGINGPIDDILFPIQHGILYYPGFDVLPPYLVYRTGRLDETGFVQVCDNLGQRLDDLWKTAPIAFRRQNAGAYKIPECTLRADIAPGQSGFAAHIEQPSHEHDVPPGYTVEQDSTS